MMTCQKCGGEFPTWMVIDGKGKCLNKRKYCLSCSPWGKHNTAQLHLPHIDGINRTCKFCKKVFVVDRLKNNKGHICNSCHVNRRRYNMKQRIVAYKGGKCEKCGYDKYVAALEFHHNDPNEKDFNIGGNHCRSFENLIKEVDKCTLLCSICHIEHHVEQDYLYDMYGFSKTVIKNE
jgi:hypothetical protein